MRIRSASLLPSRVDQACGAGQTQTGLMSTAVTSHGPVLRLRPRGMRATLPGATGWGRRRTTGHPHGFAVSASPLSTLHLHARHDPYEFSQHKT